ncbi:cyanase [Kribbella sp. NPDC051770]|uniref:cyanase n=1 Tax=Kribbella sp. NPDC051770 TaxID=3155413 RepID=UPI00343A22AF
MTDAVVRLDAGDAVLAAKRRLGLTWAEIAREVGKGKVWVTAALLGQHPIGRELAEQFGKLLELDTEVVEALQLPAVRGAHVVDTSEPAVYRLQEIVQVYGSAVNELIREEFGDGIMSAIDFEVELERVADPKGDRVVITLNGKYLQYREF